MSEWTKENQHDSEIYNEGYNDGHDAGYLDAIELLKKYMKELPKGLWSSIPDILENEMED